MKSINIEEVYLFCTGRILDTRKGKQNWNEKERIVGFFVGVRGGKHVIFSFQMSIFSDTTLWACYLLI